MSPRFLGSFRVVAQVRQTLAVVSRDRRLLRIIVILFGQFGVVGPVVTADIPQTIPGWRMELMAEAPRIRHPSVVCSAPDGRVFVAEDPMDISAPADAALGRIVCFHPDGRDTVFADKLYAVFGMQYLDGKLFVLHNPKFSVFTDERGIGKDRLDLIEQTHPDPWALDWNDHVPANFRLGMDGFFYVAVGDKGVYGAVGKDGRRVDLHGGGVLRLRPDGTALEIFCRGVRNILDVAMNAEDEFFTYDNTDEQQWMGRLTHMVDGGFYGYPYDFIPRRPYTLWMMADYGAGAATGALCYNEDALPSEYHGNLFLADFGKRQVMRVRVERAGATYRAVEKTDLFPDPPPDFRPVGIAWSADGASMLICDWQHRDVKEKVVVGRVWKLTFQGPSQPAPRPRWFVSAAQGEPFQASDDELMSALRHPARSVRMVAQRRLADRAGQTAGLSRSLARLLNDGAWPARSRWHALWACDAIDGGKGARAEILKAIDEADPSIRRQAIRQLGTRQASDAWPALVNQLRDPEPSVRFHAATALGRIGSSQAIPTLLAALAEPDSFARYAVFTALNRIGRTDSTHWPALVAGLEHPRDAIREGTEFALRETYDSTLVNALAKLAADRTKPVAAREAALRLLAEVHHQPPPWRGEWWAYHPVNSPPPAKKVAWAGTPTVLRILSESLSEPAPHLRLAAIHGLREAGYTQAAPVLRKFLTNETNLEIRRAALRALGAFRDAGSAESIAEILKAPTESSLRPDAITAAGQIGGERLVQALTGVLVGGALEPERVREILRALGELRATNAAPQIAERLASGDSAVQTAAAEALGRIGGEAALQPVLALMNHPAVEARRGAVSALGEMRNRSALGALLEAYRDPALRSETIAALARMPDERALDAYLEGLGSKNASLREVCRKAVAAIQKSALPLIEQRLERLSPDVIAELRLLYAKTPDAQRSRLFAIAAKTLEPQDYEQFALTNAGDPGRGRPLFHNPNGVACITCHRVGEQGGQVGPDLSSIGLQFGRAALIESILFPSKVVREGYNQVIVETREDEVVAGLFKGETSDELLLLDSGNRLQRLAKSQIRSRRNSELSIMPEGLHAALSLQEFADLIAYLESLKNPPRAQPAQP